MFDPSFSFVRFFFLRKEHVVVTNLSPDAAGRRRWRDAGAVGMGEDAVRRLPLFIHGNLAAELHARFGERIFKKTRFLDYFPVFFFSTGDLRARWGRFQEERRE